MTKNEIVARWMGLHCEGVSGENYYSRGEWGYEAKDLGYNSDYNWLHEVWVKFRDLKFEGETAEYILDIHKTLTRKIGWAMLNSEITEAFDELVKGIEWYNNLNK